MQVLNSKGDLSCIEQCDIIWESTFLSQKSEDFTSLNELKGKIKVVFVLEGFYQLDNERMVHAGKDVLFVHYVVDLLVLDDFDLIQLF